MELRKYIIKHYRGRIYRVGFLSILTSALMVYAGYSLTYLFTGYEEQASGLTVFLKSTAKVIIIWMAALLMMYLYKIAVAKVSAKIRTSIRGVIADEMAGLSYDEFFDKDTGNYVSWLVNDVEQMNALYITNMFAIVESVSAAIFSLVALIYLSIYIGLISIVLLLGVLILPKVLGGKLGTLSKDLSKEQETATQQFKEDIGGMFIYKTLNLYERFKTRIHQSSEQLEQSKYNFDKKKGLIITLITGINVVGQVLMVIATIYLSILGLMSIGAVLSVGNLASSFFSGVSDLIQQRVSMKAAQNIMDKFTVSSVEKNEQAAVQVEGGLTQIELNQVSFGYGEHQVLEDVSMQFEKGKKYAISGNSGCGKTTVAKLIMGFITDYTGQIRLNEKDGRAYGLNDLWKYIAYIDQNVYLFTGTIRDNITLGENYSSEELNRVVKQCKLEQLVQESDKGLDTVITENGKNLSGGQKQRIALARALIRKLDFVIMDEGTSALDRENANQIEESLFAMKDLGVIIITHHLEEEIASRLEANYHVG